MDISLYIAFAAGLVSFLSPCVLPIIPGFLAYLAGVSTAESAARRWTVFGHSALFVLGFSVVFAILGVLLNTVLERVAYDAQIWLGRVGGAIIIFFGLYLMGLLRLPFLERAHKMNVSSAASRSRGVTSFLFGAAFAAGWTPCVGAALGAILGLAASQPGSAFSLLMLYALGFGLPFLVVGLFAGRAQAWLSRFSRASRIINAIFGLVLVALGVLIFTQQLARIANFELLNQVLLR
ncbi:MAG: cytochrome C biogenesis protein [Parcubacteria group bacterium]|nr:cytochrome C biogenesis protein [Parcubacteria group bacterium]